MKNSIVCGDEKSYTTYCTEIFQGNLFILDLFIVYLSFSFAAFIKSNLPDQYPNLQIRYVHGRDPIIKLIDDSGEVKEVSRFINRISSRNVDRNFTSWFWTPKITEPELNQEAHAAFWKYRALVLPETKKNHNSENLRIWKKNFRLCCDSFRSSSWSRVLFLICARNLVWSHVFFT